MSNINQKSKTSGTREWADVTVNCCTGCQHGCLYCYAESLALQRKQVTEGQWTNQRIRHHDVVKGRRKRFQGWVMFPSSHDITPIQPERLPYRSGKTAERREQGLDRVQAPPGLYRGHLPAVWRLPGTRFCSDSPSEPAMTACCPSGNQAHRHMGKEWRRCNTHMSKAFRPQSAWNPCLIL